MNDKVIEINDAKLKDDDLKRSFDNFYTGHLVEEPEDSYANGIVLNKNFYGTIKSKRLGNFYVEPGKRYSNNNISLEKYESIIYDEKHLKTERILRKRSATPDSEPASCGYEKVKHWMNTEQEKIFHEKSKTEVFQM